MSASNHILENLSVATMQEGGMAYGLVEDGAIAISEGVIEWVGPRHDLPDEFSDYRVARFDGQLVTPALIECHSHVVFGGNRANEFEMRLAGACYEEIARAGGGITSTVNATRQANEESLLCRALARVDAMISEGVSVIEVKSGYGLNRDTELTMLRVARKIEQLRPIKIVTSYLGAHAIPPEYRGQPDDYIDEVCIPTLREAHGCGLVDYVDGFCEEIAFSDTQIARVFDCAKALGLPVKLHADQLSNSGGAALASRYGALSADHLEFTSASGVEAMAASGTVGVLLPGAFYALREKQLPPIDALRHHGVPIALGTDCNPGSSPLTSLLLAMNMACTLFRMTPEEALAGTTRNAAKALGLRRHGTIAPGHNADLAIWSVNHPAELAYHIGFNPLHKWIFGGVL